MKIRRSLFWLTILVAAIIVLVLRQGGKKQMAVPPKVTTVTNTLPPPSAVARSSAYTDEVMPKAANGAAPSNSPPEDKEQRTLGILSTYNDVPIDFYGRVEDQFGEVVVNAAITFSVRVYNGQESAVKRGQVMADGNGFFNITGYRGQELGLAAQKAGYVPATTGTLFKYSRLEDHPYVPDANNPTVIKMWKLQGAEPLVSIDQHYKLHYTSAPVSFDLLTGTIVQDGGDIKITVNRPDGIISGSNPQSWSFEIEASGGGLIDSAGQDAAIYEAPEEGYQPSETLTMSTNDNTWYEAIHRTFFVKSRNGQMYSKFGVYFRINQNPDESMNINFAGIANTNGSRNWEATAPQ